MGQPDKKWNDAGIQIAAWPNQYGYAFTVRKTFKDKKSGDWKESKSYYLSELKKMKKLIEEVVEWGELQGEGKAGKPDTFRDIKRGAPEPDGGGSSGEGSEDTPF